MQSSGAATPTIYDVADRAGVSIATVSRVLNGSAAARPATYEQVMAAVRELRFVPNSAAKGLSKGLKKVVGMVFAGAPADDHLLSVEEESLLFVDAVIRGAEAQAQQLGFSLLLNGAGGETGPQAVAALTGKVDGLVVLDQVLPERRVAPLAKRVPMVLLAGSGRTRSAYTVRVDNAGAMHDVAAHLIQVHGVTRLAFMSGRATSPDSTTRAQAFVQAATRWAPRSSPSSRGAPTGPPAGPCGPHGPGWPPATRSPRPSSAPTTRWPSGSSTPWPARGAGCPRTSPWSASTTSPSPATCPLPSPPCASRAASSAPSPSRSSPG